MTDALSHSADGGERALKILKELRPIDDVFARILFRDELGAVQNILRVVLDDPELTLTKMETQRDMKQLSGTRSIVFDVYCVDSRDRRYDLEFEKNRGGANPRRARFHCSVLDGSTLKPKERFVKMRESRVIFLTSFDYFGRGGKRYVCNRTLDDTGEDFRDGQSIIYVNGSRKGDDALGRLMHDLCCSDPDEMYDAKLTEMTRKLKTDKEEVKRMCTIIDEYREEGRKEGRIEGRKKGRKEGRKEGRRMGRKEGALSMLISLVEDGLLSVKDAAVKAEMSEAEFRKDLLKP